MIMLVLVIWAATKPGLVGGQPLSAEATIVFLVAALRLMRPLKALTQFPAALALALGSAEQVFALVRDAGHEALQCTHAAASSETASNAASRAERLALRGLSLERR